MSLWIVVAAWAISTLAYLDRLAAAAYWRHAANDYKTIALKAVAEAEERAQLIRNLAATLEGEQL